MNHNCIILDGAKVEFGDNVFVAPNCGFYTAGHPLDYETRNKGLEYAKPIKVGNNVWIGGNVQNVIMKNLKEINFKLLEEILQKYLMCKIKETVKSN